MLSSIVFFAILVVASCLAADITDKITVRHVEQPFLAFDNVCEPLTYSELYLKHQLSLPVRVDLSPDSDLVLLDVEVKADEALLSRDSKIEALARLTKRWGVVELIFLCPTFYRCNQLKEAIQGSPESLWRSVQFSLIGRSRSQDVRFDALRTTNLPTFECDKDRWVVFQRRVDSNLSFIRNWDAYVNGFGSPDSNYWMGLDELFQRTATAMKTGYPDTSRCKLRIEMRDFSDRKYWAEYGQFQVLDPSQNYRLRVGQPVAGSQIERFLEMHNEMQFTTYDRKNDKSPQSCSQSNGFGGWWSSNCHAANPNGVFATDRNIDSHPAYASLFTHNKHVPVKSTLMMFKCG